MPVNQLTESKGRARAGIARGWCGDAARGASHSTFLLAYACSGYSSDVKRQIVEMVLKGSCIRYDEPSLQCILHTVEEAHTLTELLVTVWLLARGLAMHSSHAPQGTGQCAASYSPKKVAIGVRLST